jgi:hypothetical protein
MSFVLYSRNTVIRAYFDKYVKKVYGATLKEVADALGYTTKNISDAVFNRGSTVVEYLQIERGRWYSTEDHNDGWDAVRAEQVMEDHRMGVFRVDKMVARAKAETNGRARQRPVRVARPGAEDWSHLHFWKAVLLALNELGALLKGAAKEVTYEVKPKLAEHKVQNLDDRVGSTLRLIANRLGWVADTGGDPNRWYLTPEYNRLSPEARDEVLAQWDDEGNPIKVKGPVDLSLPEASHEQEPLVLSLVAGVPSNGSPLMGHHRYEIKGEDFGLPSGARALVEVDVPLDASDEEQAKLARFILAVRKNLLGMM